MQAERDELVLRVFPAIRKVCEERGISWSEVDLRWGIPEEKTGEALAICLEFIERCRPYFIGMLGERYGWVDENIPGDLIQRYDWLKDKQDRSITELEILHGVLNNSAMTSEAFFYLRDPAYVKGIPGFTEDPTEEEIRTFGLQEANRRSQERKIKLNALAE